VDARIREVTKAFSDPDAKHSSVSGMKGRRADGERGENAALAFLENLGYTLVERNFQTRYGEIDLILRDGGTLVFCEVKLRRSTSFGEPVEAVTPAKQAKLRLVAEEYLSKREPEFEELRFDVVGILRRGADEVTHVTDAF
jgi:putative endonuclease